VPSPEKFVLTQLAAEDLNEIWGYLALDNLEFADKVLSELESAMRNLSRSPGIGHFREDLADKRHKFFLVRSYLIVYQTETKPLRIIRVLHAARDVFSLLSSSE
jgi:plasmid stabilization system protein ParE